MSNRQLAANRANSKLSTGPATSRGKDASCQNAVRHGLFSARLLLTDESGSEFRSLHQDLQVALRPSDAIENALVERIAVTLWRQRRLVGAETSTIELACEKQKVARAVSDELDLGFGSRLDAKDLEPFDAQQLEWCQIVLAEIESIEGDDIEQLREKAPCTYAQLEEDAENEDVSSYLSEYTGGLFGYFGELVLWCRQQLRHAEQRPQIISLAELIRKQRLVIEPNRLELLSRYQTTLDNQLYKALRALREAQEWRLKTMDAVPVAAATEEGAT